MARALKCDKCGQFFDYIKWLKKYQIRNMEKNKDIDLCPECYDKFLNFLEGNWRGIDHQEMVDTGELYPGEFESRHYEFEEDSE